MDTVLFACVHNVGRSQMAAAWFNRLCDPKNATAVSAGTQPAEQVHRGVVQVMREEGIELDRVKPDFLSEQLARQATLLVTMGCGDACPNVAGLQRLDWPLQDPEGQPLERIREIRDEIRGLVVKLAEERKWLLL